MTPLFHSESSCCLIPMLRAHRERNGFSSAVWSVPAEWSSGIPQLRDLCANNDLLNGNNTVCFSLTFVPSFQKILSHVIKRIKCFKINSNNTEVYKVSFLLPSLSSKKYSRRSRLFSMFIQIHICIYRYSEVFLFFCFLRRKKCLLICSSFFFFF